MENAISQWERNQTEGFPQKNHNDMEYNTVFCTILKEDVLGYALVGAFRAIKAAASK